MFTTFSGLDALIVFAATLVTFLLVRWWILRGLLRASNGMETFPKIVWEYLKTPSLLWSFAAAIEISLSAAPIPSRYAFIAKNAIVAFVIFSVALMLNAMLQRGISRLPFAMAGLSRTLTRMAVFGIGLMILLRLWGVSITPMLTALGVGGIAVALALQDTLSNIFAGVHLLVEGPLNVGDYVRVGPEEEGTVTDIGWRTTRIHTTNNTMLVVPNKTITNGTLINFDLPMPRLSIGLPILVGHTANMRQVERIAVETALATEGVLPDPPPVLIADPGIVATHLQFKLWFQAERQLGSALTRTRILHGILDRFRAEGVPPPEVTPRGER